MRRAIAFADDALQHVLQPAHDGGEIDQLGTSIARRRLKASSCRVSAAPRSAALPISMASSSRRIVRLQQRRDHVAAPENRGEHVVEVVRDAARQEPDGLHLLRLPAAALRAPASAVMSSTIPSKPLRPSASNSTARAVSQTVIGVPSFLFHVDFGCVRRGSRL